MLVSAVQLAAIVIGGVFVVLATVTVGLSTYRRRRDRLDAARRRTVRHELFTRLHQDEPDWDAFAAGLSRREMSNAAIVLERLLRQVRGDDREALLDAARSIDMGPRAEADLTASNVTDRQIALTRLALLDHPVSLEQVLTTAATAPRTRGAAARLLYERHDEFVGATEWGTRLLLWGGERILTVTGMETLYRLNQGEAVSILHVGGRNIHKWPDDLTVQVLRVLSKCQVTAPVDRLDWVLEAGAHPEYRVREAAVTALGTMGWRDDIRQRVPLATLLADHDARVRRAGYRMLASWGDEEAAGWLERSVPTEVDPWATLALYRGLVAVSGPEIERDLDLDEAIWRWVRADQMALGAAWTPMGRPRHGDGTEGVG